MIPNSPHRCTPACADRCAELLALGASIRRVIDRRETGPGVDPGPSAVDELHAKNVRLHGAARADLGRWTALIRLAGYLHACETRRKERALSEALGALERAREAEEGEARWLRVGAWLARRVDESWTQLGRRKKLVTHIDFSPSPDLAEYGEAIDETIGVDEEIQW